MRVRRRYVVAAAVAVLLVAVGFLVWSRISSTPLEDAVGRLPASTQRASFTDWQAVTSSVPRDSSTEEFLERAFEKDLTAASALSDSVEGLDAAFGVTPLGAEWEIYGQGEDGAVDLLRLSDDVSLPELEDRFSSLGYTAPSGGPGSDGVWVGTPELVACLDVPLTGLQENLAVVSSERILVMADSPDYVASAVEVVKGEADSLDSADGIPELVSAAGKATVAVLWAGDFACSDLAMSQADPEDVATGSELVASAGGVHPLAGLVMAQQADSSLVAGMVFSSSDQASSDLQPRTDLASGPAPGQGGTFPERFSVVDSVADGRVVTLTLDPVSGPLLSDLGQGPVLFATC